ncbi:hypothetical protein GCM10023162_39550 [Klenkia terrae]
MRQLLPVVAVVAAGLFVWLMTSIGRRLAEGGTILHLLGGYLLRGEWAPWSPS